MGITEVVTSMLAKDKLREFCGRYILGGRISEMHREKSDDEAYRVTALATANAEAKVIEKVTELINAQLEAVCVNGTADQVFDKALAARGLLRNLNEQASKQKNLEQVFAFATEATGSTDTANQEPLNEDWLNQFIREAENISDEQMQALWGKILAGEVKQPGSFSLRTFNVVKHLTRSECEHLTYAANYSIGHNGKLFIFPGSHPMFLEDVGLPFSRITALIDAGLVQPLTVTEFRYQLTVGKKFQLVFTFGTTSCTATGYAVHPTFTIPFYQFTRAGEDLLRFLPVKLPKPYLSAFLTFLSSAGLEVFE